MDVVCSGFSPVQGNEAPLSKPILALIVKQASAAMLYD
jgi:hypothetical protein